MGQQYSQYIDNETGVVKRPTDWDDESGFGDGVWRSSWFYASLIILRAKDNPTYHYIKDNHDVDISDAGKFLEYFRNNCLGSRGWKLPKSDSDFSRDQLVPLLYLLGAVKAYAPEFKATGKVIMKNLGKLEERGRGVSNTSGGKIGRNIGYLIDALAAKGQYNFNYRTSDMDIFLVSAAGNLEVAHTHRRDAYKTAYGLALAAYDWGGQLHPIGIDVVDEYSVFNALASLSLLRLAKGFDNKDLRNWRSRFKRHTQNGWGPAFNIVSSTGVREKEINAYINAHVKRSQDNDIIMAQRPIKIRDGILTTSLPDRSGHWLSLDFVILKALDALWIEGSQVVASITPYRHGLVTAFRNGSIYLSPDGRHIGGNGGITQRVYSGETEVITLLPFKEGIITAFTNGVITYSPDGNDPDGGGRTKKLYTGRTKVIAIVPYKEGIITAFTNGVITYSPDGNDPDGGGRTKKLYTGRTKVIAIVPYKEGIITAFTNGVITYSPDGNDPDGGGRTKKLYTGRTKVIAIVPYKEGIITAFTNGVITYSPDGNDPDGGGRTKKLYTGRTKVIAIVPYKEGIITAFTNGVITYSPDGNDPDGGGRTKKLYTGRTKIVKIIKYKQGLIYAFANGVVTFSLNGLNPAGGNDTVKFYGE